MQTFRQANPEITELSVSAWFYRNRTIAGFDNPARSLYVSIRELVENSLDACEAARVLPEIWVTLERERIMEDYSALIGSGPEVFKLTIRDNGSGMPRENVPQLIGRMLTGTKFTLRQSRGTFGLGGSLALLYGQVTTQKPIEIVTGQIGSSERHRLLMQLDIENNAPVIIDDESEFKKTSEHGTDISYYLEGDWIRSKRKVLEYFTQTSVIVPYSSMRFSDPDGKMLRLSRLTESLPRTPREMKPHPRGVDVEMLKNMISQTKTKTVSSFMTKSFQRVGATTAKKIIKNAGVESGRNPKEIAEEDLVAIMRALAAHDKFQPPSAESLSPAGVQLLETGIQRLNPDIAVIRQRRPNVYEGHPFIIEVGVAYGGDLKGGVLLYRFANRIPLLYDERSGVSNRVIRDLNLKNYGLRQDDPLAFFVHLCSTKVPYKTVGKEYIADVDVVRREIELGLKDCLRQIGEKVKRKQRASRLHKRQSRLKEYYQFMSEVLADATGLSVDTKHLFPEEAEYLD
ncbi:MAG: DNA topoisomerase VI subunit B [Candidatus Thorarchaeota archaeon]